MSNEQVLSGVKAIIDELRPHFDALSDTVWNFAELKFEEHRSAAAHKAVLASHGFVIEENLADISTAFSGVRGTGGPIIAFLGEFDALAGLSQQAGVDHPDPIVPGGSGHGCGHNLLGAGSLLAATATAAFLEQNELSGTVIYFGCPAEEGGSAKTFMARAGLFDNVDVALTWHPAPFNGVRSTNNLAVLKFIYSFKGRAAHAATAPHLGRSALDGLELMNIGVNFLREHMPSDSRVHYAITDAGGSAPNVVQSKAEALYMIRSKEMPDALDLAERVHQIARGAAMMSETEVTIRFSAAATNLLPNLALEGVIHKNLLSMGPVPFDEEDKAFAARIRATLSEETVDSAIKLFAVGEDAFHGTFDRSAPLHTGLRQFEGASHFRPGSTDVGDVSWVAPTAQCWAPTWAIGTAAHSWQAVAQGKTNGAKKAMAHAALALAKTAVDLVLDPELVEKARLEWAERTRGRRYKCPIPDDVHPPRPVLE